LANPQAENGHVDIANEIFEAFARTRIPGEARQVMDFILRKTYGWHKKQDAISLSQFVEGTGLNKPHVCQAINHLVKMNQKRQIYGYGADGRNQRSFFYEFQFLLLPSHKLPDQILAR
jgi:phage replication O-like protein O